MPGSVIDVPHFIEQLHFAERIHRLPEAGVLIHAQLSFVRQGFENALFERDTLIGADAVERLFVENKEAAIDP